MKTARKSVRTSRLTRRASRPLSLTMRVERLEKALFKRALPTSIETPKLVPRFINLGADGKPTTGDHVAVYQTETDLIWTAASLRDGANLTHSEALQAASDVRLLGHTDWRSPTIRELLSIIDYERCDPAIDPAHFKGPYGWTWTSTIAKAPAGYAWDVDLGDGLSSRDRRGLHLHALAVRAGQQLGLRL